jgi:hypothetical protein
MVEENSWNVASTLATRHAEKQDQPAGVLNQQAQGRGPGYWLAPHPPKGRAGERQHYGRHAPAQQVAGFTHIGLQHIGEHAGVDGNAVSEHEVGAKRRNEQQERGDGLERPAPGEQHQQSRIARHQEHAKAQKKEPAVWRAARCVGIRQRAPQRPIAKGGDPQRYGQNDEGGRQGGRWSAQGKTKRRGQAQ